MITTMTYKSGGLHGVQYIFELQGECISEHDHKRFKDYHNVVCLKGAVKVVGPEINSVVEAGEVLDFDGSFPHAIVSLEPGTKIINFYLDGRPPHFIDDYVETT